MDISAEARRTAAIATYFVWVGWFFVIFGFLLDMGSYFGSNRYRPSTSAA